MDRYSFDDVTDDVRHVTVLVNTDDTRHLYNSDFDSQSTCLTIHHLPRVWSISLGKTTQDHKSERCNVLARNTGFVCVVC